MLAFADSTIRRPLAVCLQRCRNVSVRALGGQVAVFLKTFCGFIPRRDQKEFVSSDLRRVLAQGWQTSPKITRVKQNCEASPLTLAPTLLRSLELRMETVKALKASQQDLFVAEPLAGPTFQNSINAESFDAINLSSSRSAS
jgi:hypothetical protein